MRNINVHAHTFDMVYCKLVCVRYSACTIFIVSTCKLKKTVRLLIVFVAAVVVLCWLLRVLRGMIAMSPIQESGGFLGRRSDWWRFQRCWRTLSNTFTQLARYEIVYEISFYSYRRPLTKSRVSWVYKIWWYICKPSPCRLSEFLSVLKLQHCFLILDCRRHHTHDPATPR